MNTYFKPLPYLHILPCLTFSLICSIMWIHFHGNLIICATLLISLTLFSYFFSFPVAEKKQYNIILLYLAFFAGIIQYQNKSYVFDAFFYKHPHITSLQGEVYAIELCCNKQFNYLLTIKTHRITSFNTNVHTTRYINIYTCRRPQCEIGDIVSLENLNLKKPSNSEFALYLKKEAISATLFLSHIPLRVLCHPTTNLKRTISSYKHKIIASLKNKLSPLAYSLFLTIFLGKKSPNKYPIRQTCKIWGISHYLARSGLHLLLFVLILQILLSLTYIEYRLQSIFLIILGIIYYILSWPSVSFNRAFFAFILEKSATLMLLSIPSCHILNLVCFFTLLNNPYHLFFLDFQLSFSLAFTITYFNEFFRQKQYTHLKTPILH
jgi:ComEC/Rec2-related protein